MIYDAAGHFAANLDALVDRDVRLGIAVSGGPDSLALLLLAAEARRGQVEAATVDHALREGSRAEAEQVAALCIERAIPHAILTARWAVPPIGNIQARARTERYALLGGWARDRGLATVATAHHADDQAETLLMRLARGSGVNGLAGTRPRRPLADGIDLIRPLLGWRRAALAAIVADAGLTPVDDPANHDPRHDRSRIRAVLADAVWADPLRLASSAAHLRNADEALDWALAPLLADRLTKVGSTIEIDPSNLPREFQRRLLLAAFARLGAPVPRGPELTAALDRLLAGQPSTLSGLKLDEVGSIEQPKWRVGRARPRRLQPVPD